MKPRQALGSFCLLFLIGTAFGWPVDVASIRPDLLAMLGITALVVIVSGVRKRIDAPVGVFLLAFYVIYIGVVSVQALER